MERSSDVVRAVCECPPPVPKPQQRRQQSTPQSIQAALWDFCFHSIHTLLALVRMQSEYHKHIPEVRVTERVRAEGDRE